MILWRLLSRFIQTITWCRNILIWLFILSLPWKFALFFSEFINRWLPDRFLDPLLMVNMNENMDAAAAAGQHAPHIINSAFHQVYGAL